MRPLSLVVDLGYLKNLLLTNIFFRTDISMEVVNKIELKGNLHQRSGRERFV